jgi:hypothetical protein
LKAHHNGHEHEFEPEYGLPEKLPQDERILWQGNPDTALVFRHVFHAPGLAVYFGLILLARGGQHYADTGSLAEAMAAALWLAPVFGLGLLLFWAMAYLVAKTTVYTLTSRRVAMRIGIVLNLTLNLPLARMQAAQVRPLTKRSPDEDGPGEIALILHSDDKVAYPHLWPHARPWQFAHPRPMLRALPAVKGLGQLLTKAWQANQSGQSADVGVAQPRGAVNAIASTRGRPPLANEPARQGGVNDMEPA